MGPFPLSNIPPSNLLSVLEKMEFREASRMRATCHQINGIVAESSRLSFKFPRDTSLSVVVRPSMDPYYGGYLNTLELQVHVDRKWSEWNCWAGHSWFSQRIVSILDPAQPHNVEHGYFKNVNISVMGPWPSNFVGELGFLSFFKEAKIQKCDWLTYSVETPMDGLDLIAWVKLIRPLGVIWSTFYGEHMTNPMPFEVLRELADTGCKYITSEICEWFPLDYVSVLLRYQGVWIVHVWEDSMPSVEPIVQALLGEAPSTMWYCRLPVYNRENFLTPGEIAALGLGESKIRWIGDQQDRLAFFTTTSDYFVTLTEYRGADKIFTPWNQHYCICRRVPKSDIETFIEFWIRDFLPADIPFDASGIYEYAEENRDGYEMIRDQLETISVEIPSFY